MYTHITIYTMCIYIYIYTYIYICTHMYVYTYIYIYIYIRTHIYRAADNRLLREAGPEDPGLEGNSRGHRA